MDARRRASRPRRRRRRSACRPTTSRRAYRAFDGKREQPALRGRLTWPTAAYPRLAVLRGAPPRARRTSSTRSRAGLGELAHGDDDARRDLPRARATARRRRPARASTARDSTCARSASRARRSRYHGGARRLRLRHAGPRLGRRLALRHATRSARRCCRGVVARRRRSRRSRSPSRRPAPTSRRCATRAPTRRRRLRARRRQACISNVGIADIYVVFARTGEAPGARGLSRVPRRRGRARPRSPSGSRRSRRTRSATLALRRAACRRDALDRRAPAAASSVAMATLDVFRTTVGAAALGFARARLDEALARVTRAPAVRRAARRPAARPGKARRHGARDRRRALLVYRAAWAKDTGARARDARGRDGEALRDRGRAARRSTRAVQLHGGLGVVAAATRSSGSTARSGRSASTRARARSSS